MVGATIGTKHTYNDWGLILTDKVISPPVPKTNMVEVPLCDGSLDLTESLTDDVKYEDRKIVLTFKVLDPIKEWPLKMSTILNYLHGQRLQIVFDDDAAYYYIGRVVVNEWASNKKPGTLVIEGAVDPYKYDMTSSAEEWEWDSFDFEDGIINELSDLVIVGETEITIVCRKKRVFPTFIASTPMTVTFEGNTYNVAAGSQKLYDITLKEGYNTLVFKGTGTLTIDYTGGSL